MQFLRTASKLMLEQQLSAKTLNTEKESKNKCANNNADLRTRIVGCECYVKRLTRDTLMFSAVFENCKENQAKTFCETSQKDSFTVCVTRLRYADLQRFYHGSDNYAICVMLGIVIDSKTL